MKVRDRRRPLRRAAAFLALVLSPSLGAQPASAVTTQAFLPLSFGARAYAMGGALIALSNDAGSTLINPARLVYLETRSASAGYSNLVESVTTDRIEMAVATTLGEEISAPLQVGSTHKTAVGAAVEYLGIDLSQGSRYWELGLTAAGAWAPSNFAAFGIGVRYLRADSGLDGVSATGAALDLGASIALHPSIEFAVVVRNLGGSVEFDDSPSEGLVREISTAVAWTRSGRISAELDFTVQEEEASLVSLGIEALLGDVIAIRVGGRQWIEPESRTIPAAGIGIRLGNLQLDYGAQFDEDEALGTAHRVTLGGRF